MNRLFLLLFGMVTFVAHAQVPDYVPTEGLVAWFNMDGEIVNEVNGSAGIGTGTIAAPDRNNVPGASLAFSNGAFGVLNNASIPTADITVTAWVNQSQSWSIGGGIEFICIGSPSSTTWGTIAGPEFIILNRGRGCSGGGEILTDYNFPLNEWVHLAYVSGGLGMPTDIYINGMYQGQSLNNSAGTCDASNLYFGVDIFSLPEHIEGGLDDIGIWNGALTEEEILALFTGEIGIPGCIDPTACNFNEEANEDDGSCVYPPSESVDCEFGGNYCGDGTAWDSSLQICVGFDDCPADLNGNGLVEVSDLLMVLADFGTECAPPVAEWTCGDPVNYHGYDYATVQIGEQCWFAENLRSAFYANGDTIETNLSILQWSSTSEGAQVIYGDDAFGINGGNPNEESNFNDYGLLYNWFAASDARGLCPIGWHIPTDLDFIHLEVELGMSEIDANSTGWRGHEQATALKSSPSDIPSWNGSNISEFGALPGGRLYPQGIFNLEGDDGDGHCNFWDASNGGRVIHQSAGIYRGFNFNPNFGYSVRCIKD